MTDHHLSADRYPYDHRDDRRSWVAAFFAQAPLAPFTVRRQVTGPESPAGPGCWFVVYDARGVRLESFRRRRDTLAHVAARTAAAEGRS